ncbi:MAG TPA: hemolysin III family protein [Caulobacteraceae bacterium]|nr:hemolysin III family protein [Caulobacteraceae bacterium]
MAGPGVLPPHYPTVAAEHADLVSHVAGLILALFGGGVMLGVTLGAWQTGEIAAVSVYVACLVLMMSLSAAYNFANGPLRPLLRRLDHCGIFLMIAGSYTPFTTHNLTGAWSFGMTTAVWLVALLGICGKLFLPDLGNRCWVSVYLAMGWLVLVALRPLIAGTARLPLYLLALAGVLYTSGLLFCLSNKLEFRRAIWHAHVVAAAGAHWTAVLLGVVLAEAR